MLPAQRRDMGEQFVGHVDTADAQLLDGAVEIEGIPQRDSRSDKGQAGGAMALVFDGTVAQFAEAVEEDGGGERVAGLALVEDAVGTASLLGIVELLIRRMPEVERAAAAGELVVSGVDSMAMTSDTGPSRLTSCVT